MLQCYKLGASFTAQVLNPEDVFPNEQACLGILLSWLDITLPCYKLIPIVHIMPILVALAAEVLGTKHFTPAAFGVLLFCVLVVTIRLLYCFCPMESLLGFGGSG